MTTLCREIDQSLQVRLQRAVRARVCRYCFRRAGPLHWVGPELSRPCEPECQVFQHLSALASIAEDCEVEQPNRLEERVVAEVCEECGISPSPGANCPNRAARICPLSRYATRALLAMEPVVHQRLSAD